VSRAKTAEPIEMPFGVKDLGGPRKPDPPREGTILGEGSSHWLRACVFSAGGVGSMYRQSSQATDSVDDFDMWTDMIGSVERS